MQTKLQEASQRLFELQKQFPVKVARQRALMAGHTDVERGLRMMIEGVELYLRGLRDVHKTTPRTDGYLRDMVRDVLNGVSGLLNEAGHFDEATCSRAIKLINDEYGV